MEIYRKVGRERWVKKGEGRVTEDVGQGAGREIDYGKEINRRTVNCERRKR